MGQNAFQSGTGPRNKTYSNLYDPATGQVTEFLVTQPNHDMFCPGTAFLEDGRLLVNGGGPHVTTTSIYDFSGNQWVRGASMSRRRWYNASTTLPGGGVFTLGGNPDDGVGELWTAGAGWSVLAGAPVTPMTMDAGSYMYRSEQHPKVLVAPSGKLFAAGPTPNMQWYDTASTPRTYHSTALLLPNGRVFSGGGGLCGTCGVNHADGEIYSPPYLFQGPRPVIQGAPTVVGYNAPLSIATTGNVARFTFVRLSSTTHTVNTDQRFLPLASAPNGGGSFTVTSPLNANIAPPGYYMLFALSAAGLPSVSRIVKLSGAPGGGSFRYVKLEEVSEVSGKAFGSAAEFNVVDTRGNRISRTGWVASADSAETPRARRLFLRPTP